jgi:hypothetical protein
VSSRVAAAAVDRVRHARAAIAALTINRVRGGLDEST